MFDEARARLTPGSPGATVYCGEPHRGGRTKKLAEAYWLNPELLFVSHIDWLPSDELNLRPWTREQLLGSGWNSHLDHDDVMLSEWLDHLDSWSGGVAASGERWLKRPEGPHRIAVVLKPGSDPVYSTWVRCPDHPGDARIVGVTELMATIRGVS